eukprot:6280048-Prymnesium_polylepis.1
MATKLVCRQSALIRRTWLSTCVRTIGSTESYSLRGKSTHPQPPSLTCGLGRWGAFMDVGSPGKKTHKARGQYIGFCKWHISAFPSGKSYVGQTVRWDRRMKHAVRLSRKAAKRIDPDYGRGPVK